MHSVHLHTPVGYVVKQDQLPQLLGHKPLQDPQVNGAEVTAAKVARENLKGSQVKTLSKRFCHISPSPWLTRIPKWLLKVRQPLKLAALQEQDTRKV